MDIFQALILGVVQGATEFLPISSSAHLVLVPWWLNWSNPGLAFDTILHLGTIVAVIVYFYCDLWRIIVAWLRMVLRRETGDPAARLGWWLIVGTVPAAVLGAVLEDFFESLFAFPPGVAVLLIVTGVILAASEHLGKRIRSLEDLRWSDALVIGAAQACAIAPGISRSGVTIAAGLGKGLKRADAARFSFLLSVPVIVGAGLKQSFHLATEPTQPDQLLLLVVGLVAAAVTGYLAIHFLLRYLQHRNLYPFAVYCWLMGGISLLAALLGW